MKRKILGMFLALVMVASVVSIAPKEAKAATASGTVTVTVEKLTIGQGLVYAPTQIAIYSGDTVLSVYNRLMDYYFGAYTKSQAGYLVSINDIMTSNVINIPDEISTGLSAYTYSIVDERGLLVNETIAAPNNLRHDGNKDANLGEGDFGKLSGWLFSVNNKSFASSAEIDRLDGYDSTNPTVRNLYKKMQEVPVSNGDVIRFMFSVYGFGADLGFDSSAKTGIAPVKLADKTELIKAVGNINAKKSYFTVYPNIAAAYNVANSLVYKYNPSQDSINQAVAALRAAELNPQNPVIAKVTIKSLKKAKGGKVKITLKKVANATGYKIKYSNNKKYKNKPAQGKICKNITKKTLTYTTQKIGLLKDKRIYVRVRAYKSVNGKKVWGPWSAKKKIKLK